MAWYRKKPVVCAEIDQERIIEKGVRLNDKL